MNDFVEAVSMTITTKKGAVLITQSTDGVPKDSIAKLVYNMADGTTRAANIKQAGTDEVEGYPV